MTVGLKWGAIVGAVYYVVGLGLQVLYNVLLGHGTSDITQRPILLVPTCLSFFALLFACSAAGFYTGRESGRAGLGALAGVAALVVQDVLGHLYAVHTTSATGGTAGGSTLNPVAAFVLAVVIPALLVLGLGAAMGWLGGRPGAQQHARRAAAEAAAAVVREPPRSEG